MSLISATATFTPGASPRQVVVDSGLLVRMFGAVQRAQRVVVEHAQSIVPVDTGDLQSSIHATEPTDDFKQILGEVVADSDHAGFVEFGTGLRGAGTYPYPLPTAGVPITGGWVYDYKQQQWVGMPASPYMRPALDAARAEVLEEFRS